MVHRPCRFNGKSYPHDLEIMASAKIMKCIDSERQERVIPFIALGPYGAKTKIRGYFMILGKFTIDAVETGFFALDGGAMFGIVPKPLWSKTYHPGDEMNRIPLAARLLLIRWEDHILLVDVGNGTKMDEKFCNIYGIDREKSSVDYALRPFGLKAEDVTDVILTHLHFDHAGGATIKKNGKVTPAFPNARYYLQKDQLKLAESPSLKDAASFIPDNYIPLTTDGLVETVDGEGEIYPGIMVKALFGHTKAMQVVIIEDEGQSLLYCADLIPTSAHIHIPFIMAYDNDPLITIDEKKSILPRAFEENWILVFEHDAFRQAAKIGLNHKGGFEYREKIELTPSSTRRKCFDSKEPQTHC
jgi:glyoxylase-like metal-dependent hydrolase (beta-lactamase superfamily II)